MKSVNICYINSSVGSIKIKLANFINNVNNREFKINLYQYNNIPIKNNSIYLFIKHIDDKLLKTVKILKSKGNYLIYEPLDLLWNEESKEIFIEKITKLCNNFSHIIFNNKYYSELILTTEASKSIIYHEFDNSFLKNNSEINDGVYFIGTLKKSSLNENLIKKFNVNVIDTIKKESFNNNFKKNIKGIHLNYILKNNPYFKMSTATKLSTSLVLDSIFISNKIPVFTEILGEDYEFFFKDDLSDLEDIILKAKNIINDKNLYNMHLYNMKEVKYKLSNINTSYQYHNIFRSIKI